MIMYTQTQTVPCMLMTYYYMLTPKEFGLTNVICKSGTLYEKLQIFLLSCLILVTYSTMENDLGVSMTDEEWDTALTGVSFLIHTLKTPLSTVQKCPTGYAFQKHQELSQI